MLYNLTVIVNTLRFDSACQTVWLKFAIVWYRFKKINIGHVWLKVMSALSSLLSKLNQLGGTALFVVQTREECAAEPKETQTSAVAERSSRVGGRQVGVKVWYWKLHVWRTNPSLLPSHQILSTLAASLTDNISRELWGWRPLPHPALSEAGLDVVTGRHQQVYNQRTKEGGRRRRTVRSDFS